MNIKTVMVGAALLAACFVSTESYSAESGNVVGYHSYTIKKGINKIKVDFQGIGGESQKIDVMLKDALEGDRIKIGNFHAVAKMVDNKLHWVSKGKIVDDQVFPESPVTFRYFRTVDKTTELGLSGEVEGSLLEEPTPVSAPKAALPKVPVPQAATSAPQATPSEKKEKK